MINANVSTLLTACSKVCLISVSLSIIIKLDHFAFLCFSVLKGYTIQHLPDGTVIVESIVIKVSSSAEDSNTKVLLLSWSYQVKTCTFFLERFVIIYSFKCSEQQQDRELIDIQWGGKKIH